jgi:hypothetical protein
MPVFGVTFGGCCSAHKVGWSFNGTDPSSFEASFEPTI